MKMPPPPACATACNPSAMNTCPAGFHCETTTNHCGAECTPGGGECAQGETPFLGAWLRERILQVLPRNFTPRARDENAWNASVAWLLGTSYTLTHATDFLDAYLAVIGELAVRDTDNDGALGRDASFPEAETLPTWAWACAMDALQAR